MKKENISFSYAYMLVLISPRCALAFSCAYACAYACASLANVNQALRLTQFEVPYLVEVYNSVSQAFRGEWCLPRVTGCRSGQGASRLHIFYIVIDSFRDGFCRNRALPGL